MAKINGIIVGIDEKGANSLYRVVFYIRKPEGTQYNKQVLQGQDIINKIKSGLIELDNAEVVNNQLKGKTGDLSRFKATGFHPMVILSEMYANDVLIGYRLVTYEGVVKAARLKDVLAYCARVHKNGAPIQNAMYVSETAETKPHIRAYPYQTFYREVIERRPSKNVESAHIDKKANGKQVSRLEELFNKDQIRELKLGRDNGVDIRVYGNNKLSAEQMKQLRLALESGVNAKAFADPAFSVESMKALRINARYGVDITYFINPRYDANQIYELSTGYISGVDIAKYADPNISAKDMSKTRVYLESKLWVEEEASTDNKILF